MSEQFDKEPFLRNSKLQRSPIRSFEEQNSSTKKTDLDRNSHKRRHETTLDDLVRLIEANSEKLDEMKVEITEKLEESLQKIDKKIELVEGKADQGIRMAMENQKLCANNEKAVNYLMQEKLMNRMEISGHHKNSCNDKNKLKEDVIELIKAHNVNIECDDINFVFTKTVNKYRNGKAETKTLIIVDFKDFGTKVRVMKEKRNSKINNGVFFDNSLTAANRSMMGKVKKISKEKNFKTYMSNNRIHVKKSDNRIQTVEAASDLKIIESWSPNKEVAKSDIVNSSSA